jgi:type II restriction enzyme
LQAAYQKERAAHQVPLQLPDGSKVYLSPGKHNRLQVAVIEEFGPRFAPGALVLYVGDTAKKHVVFQKEQIAELNIPITEHDELPDIVLYWPDKNWLFLIEAVTSHGPVSPKRHQELESMLAGCTADRIYVTGFLAMSDFRKFAADIAWETEVWIAENPDHLIHFNGPKFLGPYKGRETKSS